VDNQFSQHYLLKKLSFLHNILRAPLSKISWLYLCRFKFVSSTLFHLHVCFCANTMLFLLLSLWIIIWSYILGYLQHWTFFSDLLSLFKVFCASIWTLGLIFHKHGRSFRFLMPVILSSVIYTFHWKGLFFFHYNNS
jgi:hypothetical protein